ncbi:MAG: endonuclease/exonuclease/phosphatase family protein, partial [Gammaproteobacteria bacterium]|nr:endonuclease/exonuclease/phosphatase family protein [Gammaproteobacteria bacterium]
MKIMTLNIWGGHVREPLLDFFKTHKDVDCFCLQEVYHEASHKVSTDDRWVDLNILSAIQNCLPNHHAYFRPVVHGFYGIALLMKKDLAVIEEGDFLIYENQAYEGMGPHHSRNLQWIRFKKDAQEYIVVNVHGLWNGQGKGDSPERL